MSIADVLASWIEGRFAPTFNDQMTAIRLVREKGVTYKVFVRAARHMGLTKQLAFDYLRISKQTQARLKEGSALNRDHAERLFRLIRIYSEAKEVLGSTEKAWAWLDRENRALGGIKPLSLLDTEVGAQCVSDVLGRITHGAFS